MQTPPTPPSYIPALTGVRALAAYLVFFHHFNPFPANSWGGRFLHEGHIGVTIFFVLSGFLICFRYIGKVQLTSSWLRQYFTNRIARIYPLYALLTLLTFLVICNSPSYDESGQWASYTGVDKLLVVGLNLSFLRGFSEQFLFTGIGQGWSLTTEECFYCFAPVLLWGLMRWQAKYWWLVGASLLLIAIGCMLVRMLPHPYGFFGSYLFMFNRTFFGRAFEFIAGAGVALFYHHHSRPRVGTWATGAGIIWIGACQGGMSLFRTEILPSWQTAEGVAINNGLVPLGVAILFFGLLTERTWLSRLLATNALQILGKSSFAFYLIHMGVLSHWLLYYVPSYLALFGVSLLVSYALWRWVEEPLSYRLRAALTPPSRSGR